MSSRGGAADVSRGCIIEIKSRGGIEGKSRGGIVEG